ncbi:MAG: PAS domain S-box protein [Thermodesulfobacteriota bacterium]
MTDTPIVAELEKRIRQLEKAAAVRNKVEADLRETESRYRALFDRAGDMIFIHDLSGRFMEINQATCDRLGYDPKDFFQLTPADILAPEEIPPLNRLKDAINGCDHITYETILMTKAGRAVPIEANCRRIEYLGKPAVLCIARDITVRKKTETALRLSEERFRTAFQTSPDSISISRLSDGLFIDINEGFTDLTGYAREDVEGKTSLDINVWDNSQDRQRLVTGLKEKGVVKNLEAPFRLKDGTVRTGLMSARVIMLHDEPHILSVTRDIEDLKATQKALVESEEKYRQLVDHAMDAIFIAQDEVIKFSNPRTWDLTGHSSKELATTPFITLIHPEDRNMVLERHRKRLAGEKPESTYAFRIISKAGQEHWVQLSTTLTSWNGRPATLNFIRDITSQKKLEDELRQAQKMEAIGTLAGGIAHDFNNLLMGIQGHTSLMLLEMDRSHSHYEHLKGVEEMVRSAAGLTKQLLGFARRGKYEARPTDLNELVRKSIHLFSRTKKEIRIHSKFTETLWTADVDAGQIEQVLLNIYVNAWQAMSGKGEIFIETENIVLDAPAAKTLNAEPGRFVRISIADTGVGMDEKTRLRIFDPFFTTKKMGRGTGLGLSSAYSIIKNHHGFITVDSKIGKGSTFGIFIPASGSQVIKEIHSEDSTLQGTGTVLLVDDEEMILNVNRLLLEKFGFRVFTAGSGNEAVDIYQREKDHIALVILDVIMPGMGGGETYDLLKSINPDIKILLSSGYSLDGQAKEMIKRGCNGFIQKPFDLKGLSKKLKEILDA